MYLGENDTKDNNDKFMAIRDFTGTNPSDIYKVQLVRSMRSKGV